MRVCRICGGKLAPCAILDVCRSNPECKRINVSIHNFNKTRRRGMRKSCARCGNDWLGELGLSKLCPTCRIDYSWCGGYMPGNTGHITLIDKMVDSNRCRACRLLNKACERANELGLPFNIDPEYIESIWNEACPYLGTKLQYSGTGRQWRHSPTIDRIIPSQGYIKGNVQIISLKANAMKQDATPNELISFARAILERASA